MDPFFLSILLTISINNITMEKKQTLKTDDTEVLSPVVEKKATVKKVAKEAPKAEPKKEEVKKDDAAAAKEARRRRLLGYA